EDGPITTDARWQQKHSKPVITSSTSNCAGGRDAATHTKEGAGLRTNTGMCRKERAGTSKASKPRYGTIARHTSKRKSKSREPTALTMVISSTGANDSRTTPCAMGGKESFCANSRGSAAGVDCAFKTPMSWKWTTLRPKAKGEAKNSATNSCCIVIAMTRD